MRRQEELTCRIQDKRAKAAKRSQKGLQVVKKEAAGFARQGAAGLRRAGLRMYLSDVHHIQRTGSSIFVSKSNTLQSRFSTRGAKVSASSLVVMITC